ncbi:MAG: DNA-binding domain-containing protein [Terriglobales bacterium]
MNLLEIQTQMLEAIMQPLTSGYNMQRRARDGRAMRDVAAGFIKANDRLSSFERLEIYNRQYWYRVLDSLEEDFPGLLAIVGRRRFGSLSKAYVLDCPSQSFTLRDLGWRLESWLRAHTEYIHPREKLALDMVRLEWAEIEVFDAAEHPVLIPEALLSTDPDPRFTLQPYLRLLELQYPVDDLLVGIKAVVHENEVASNAVAAPGKHGRVRKIARQKPQTIFLAVHRQDDSVYFKRLERDAFLFLGALREGKRLSDAAVLAFEGSGRSSDEIPGRVRGWFEEWAALGWFAQPAVVE